MTHRERRSYDHRVKAQVIAADNPNPFPELEIPRATALGWIRRGLGEVVSLDGDQKAESQLRDRVARLEQRVSALTAVLRLVRKIMAWTVASKPNPMNTSLVLNRAAACLSVPETKVYMDSGVENLNRDVDQLLEADTLERVIAQIYVTFSNSLIEAWWHSLKHEWLFVNHFDCLDTPRKLVEFYVEEHNDTLPHDAFRGQTPNEIYFGRGETVPDELAKRRREARRSRVEHNRNIACSDCP